MQSHRDELARAVRPVLSEYGAWGIVPPEQPVGVLAWGDSLASEYSDCPESIADALWAEGWRKKPSREEVARALYVADNWGVPDAGTQWDEGRVLSIRIHKAFGLADAILALMDGHTETGDKDER